MEKKTQLSIIPLAFVSFFLACNYFILKALKETLLVTSPDTGAEAIPFVKMWLLFPISVCFLVAFTWIANRKSLKFAVSTMILFFLSSYAIFAFILYPLRESLHLHTFADYLQTVLPAGWRGLASVVRYWSYSLFYVVAECWCTMVYSVVFWGYANAIIRFSDAQKYYPYLTLAGTLAALVAGPLTIFITKLNQWDFAFYGLTLTVLINGCCALALLQNYCPSTAPMQKGAKKPPFWASIAAVFRSKYLLTLAAICITYNLLVNLTDVVWKDQVLKLYPDPAEFTSYLSYVTLITGLISTGMTLFVCRQSLRRYGWTKTALITPLLALTTGGVFFVSIFVSLPLAAITLLGSIHICLSCGAKYTLFEPTKEMAFIPLPQEEKLMGKAAIDGIGVRLGKTSSSFIYQLLLVVLPTISACTPIVGILMVAIVVVCISSIISLGQQIEPLQSLNSQ